MVKKADCHYLARMERNLPIAWLKLFTMRRLFYISNGWNQFTLAMIGCMIRTP